MSEDQVGWAWQQKKEAGRSRDVQALYKGIRREKKLRILVDTFPNLEGQTPEQLIHELEVHQVELETQGRRTHKSAYRTRRIAGQVP